MSGRDEIFKDGAAFSDAFEFDAKVAGVFPDMIRRSVPGYDALERLTGLAAAEFAAEGTRCYDLGCSLGGASFAVVDAVEASGGIPGFEVIAVDNSKAMIAGLEARLAHRGTGGVPVNVVLADVLDVEISRASVVVLNYTLQFVSVERRECLLERVFDGLVPGGALILTEKIVFGEQRTDSLVSALHDAFKRANGYSDLEIAGKRAALEDVLIPETSEAHEVRLKGVGFYIVAKWFQALNFASFLAVKDKS